MTSVSENSEAGVSLVAWLTRKAEIFYVEGMRDSFINTIERIEREVGTNTAKVIRLGIEASYS